MDEDLKRVVKHLFNIDKMLYEVKDILYEMKENTREADRIEDLIDEACYELVKIYKILRKREENESIQVE